MSRFFPKYLLFPSSSPSSSFPFHIYGSKPLSTSSSLRPRRQHRAPASYYRGGTSRALIFPSSSLPENRSLWPTIFLSALGSPDVYGRQLDGLGGGISSLSKVCVVGRSAPGDAYADVDYTFAAVGVRDREVDFSSNCGNMTSAVGPFALDSGLVAVEEILEGEGEGDGDGARDEMMALVRIRNTNTGKIIHARFPVVEGEAAAYGDFAIDGVAGTAARVELSFVDPAGSKTGKLLPTGNVVDVFDGVRATCIDAGNPCVFIQARDVGVAGTILPDDIDAHPTLLETLDSIRRRASVAMGVSTDLASTPGSIPKIALVSRRSSHVLLSGEMIEGANVDLVVRALSVGQPHRAVPITVAMAVAAAANLEGSIVRGVLEGERVDQGGITVGHPSGKILVGAKFDERGTLKKVTVIRTARRLMEGFVYWK